MKREMQHPSDRRLMAFALHSLRKLCSVYHWENPTVWNLSIWQTQMHLMNRVNQWIWREKKSPCELSHLKYMCVRIGCVWFLCSPMHKKKYCLLHFEFVFLQQNWNTWTWFRWTINVSSLILGHGFKIPHKIIKIL